MSMLWWHKSILVGYTNSDTVGDVDTKRSTLDYLFAFELGAMTQRSKLQNCVVFFTTEPEYIDVAEVCKEMLWSMDLLEKLDLEQDGYVIYCDRQNTVNLSKNSIYHTRTKHIDVHYIWIQDILEKLQMKIVKISIDYNPLNMTTKPLTIEKQKCCNDLMGVGAWRAWALACGMH